MFNQTAIFFKKIYLPLFISLFFALSSLFTIQIHAKETVVFYTVHLKKLHPDVLDALSKSKEITDAVSKSFVGRIEKIAITPHMEETYASADDCMVLVPHPFYRDVALTVRTVCTPQKNSYRIGAFNLFKGAQLHFFTADFTGSGECAEIYESEISP